jgi:hypothetical protein
MPCPDADLQANGKHSTMKYVLPLALLMVLHTAFVLLNDYSITYLDSAMHFAGGIVLGYFILGQIGYAVRKGWCGDPGRVVVLVLIVSLVTTGAVCWEIYEWLSDMYIGTHFQPSLDDTMKDLVLGLTGGIFCAGAVFCARAYEGMLEPNGRERRPLRHGS